MFFKKHKIIPVSLKLYSQPLEQMKIVRFLGMWFDEKLTWKIHLEKMVNKCKKIVNILRCLSGQAWGASKASLQNIYWH